MRRSINLLSGSIFLGCLLATIMLVGIGWAQGTRDEIVVSENLKVTWAVLLILLATGGTYAATIGGLIKHTQNSDRHLSDGDIGKAFPRREECIIKHAGITDDIKALGKKIDDADFGGIREHLRSIDQSLERLSRK